MSPLGAMPKGYICAEFVVIDVGGWAKYVPLAQASLAPFGGRYVVGPDLEVLEGELGGRRISILEFESLEKARGWYHSPQYQAAKALRLTAARVTALLLSAPESQPVGIGPSRTGSATAPGPAERDDQ